jgi:general secretion pathway protein A
VKYKKVMISSRSSFITTRPSTDARSAQPPLNNALPQRRADECGPQGAKLQTIGRLRAELLYERYGILENPFGVTPNPRYLYQSRTHAEATSSLVVGIEYGVGFQALVAPPGMGKTTILFDVLERFSKVARIAFLSQIHGDSRDFLRYLISELGGEAHDSDLVRLQNTINQLLIRECRVGRQTIIIIDEAQSLNTSVLETVRRLSNFETPTEKLVLIILAGQPRLAQRLANSELAQLNQRISILTTLIPFDLQDTKNYIAHRLDIAGYQGPPLFTSAAVRLIWKRSGGIPRKINTLCFNALLLARAFEQKQVDSDILHEVVADLDLDRIRFNTDTPTDGTREVQSANGPQLGNAAGDAPATSIDKICKASVSGAKAEADDASTRPTAFDGVDLVQLGTPAAEIVSTNCGEKTEHAAVSSAKAEVDDASTRPAAFDGVGLVQLGTPAAEIVSTSREGKANLPAVSGAKAGADDASTRPTVFDGVDLVELETLAAKIVSASSGRNADPAALPGAGTGSDNVVGHVFLPDTPALATHRKTDVVTVAGTRVGDAPSCETEAAGSSTDAPHVGPEALAVEVESMPEAKQDLSLEVESELTSKARFDFPNGIKPDLKPEIEPESESGVESTLEVEPTVTAVAPLRIILGETDEWISPRTSPREAPKARKQKWQVQGATIYLATSLLVFLLVLGDLARSWQNSPEPRLTIFEKLLSSFGLGAPPPMPARHDKPDTRVWVDSDTGLYYCPGAELYGKTREGEFVTERHAQLEHLTAANRKACQ